MANGQQHGVAAQPFDRLSPLYAAKHDADDNSSHAAQPVDQTSLQQVGHSDSNGVVGSKVVSATSEAAQPNASAGEATPSSKYPHTKLYQLADIELAHGH